MCILVYVVCVYRCLCEVFCYDGIIKYGKRNLNQNIKFIESVTLKQLSVYTVMLFLRT